MSVMTGGACPFTRCRRVYTVTLTPTRFGWRWSTAQSVGIYKHVVGDHDWLMNEGPYGWRPTRRWAQRRAERRVARDKAEDARLAAAVTLPV